MTRLLNQSDRESVRPRWKALLPQLCADDAVSWCGHCRQSSRSFEALSSRPTSVVADQIVIVSTGLGTGPSDICRRSREPASARASAMYQTRSTQRSPSFLAITAHYGRCSTRFARSMPSFCAAARGSTKWTQLSQPSILPRRAPSSPT